MPFARTILYLTEPFELCRKINKTTTGKKTSKSQRATRRVQEPCRSLVGSRHHRSAALGFAPSGSQWEDTRLVYKPSFDVLILQVHRKPIIKRRLIEEEEN